MDTLNIELYDTLKKELKLTEEEARHVTIAIEHAVKHEVKTDITEYKSLFKQDFKDLEGKLDTKIKDLESKLELKIEQSSNNNLKWFIGMFFALALLIIGIYIKK